MSAGKTGIDQMIGLAFKPGMRLPGFSRVGIAIDRIAGAKSMNPASLTWHLFGFGLTFRRLQQSDGQAQDSQDSLNLKEYLEMKKSLLCLLALLPCLAFAGTSVAQTGSQTMHAYASQAPHAGLMRVALNGRWRYPLGTHPPGGVLHPGAIHCTRSPRNPLNPADVLHPRPTTCHSG
ncbi:hypothetical protein ACPRNU_24280 [Chromobacterium vaccinii]|uniref:hypothetical protein n=1 Tax=Chromobacterium vaccinii TaxID=1108595 RepID=UPI003C743A67